MGADAKKNAYGFIKTKFRELKNDETKWADILREDKQFVEAAKERKACTVL